MVNQGGRGAPNTSSLGGSQAASSFATVQPTLEDASAKLVDSMRETLRQATEIHDSLSEAEAVVARARAIGVAADAAASEAELRVVASEIERINTFLTSGTRPQEKSSNNSNMPFLSLPVATALAQMAAETPSSSPHCSLSMGSPAPSSAASGVAAALAAMSAPVLAASGPAVATVMAQEIDDTVTWVHQLLETVNLVKDPQFKHENGASLVPALQPRMRERDDGALRAALSLDVHAKGGPTEAPAAAPAPAAKAAKAPASPEAGAEAQAAAPVAASESTAALAAPDPGAEATGVGAVTTSDATDTAAIAEAGAAA